MNYKVYAKASVNLTTKRGAYGYQLVDGDGNVLANAKPFKTLIKTLAQSDCQAFVNALYILASTPAADNAENIEVITDSQVVIDLLEVFKSQKHCDVIAQTWREKIKPAFKVLQAIKYTKVGRVPLAGDRHTFTLQRCEVAANYQLGNLEDLVK